MVTTVTILLAMLGWTLAICRGCEFPAGKQGKLTIFWSISFLLFAIHIVAAFQEHYHWSHQFALTETARQTKELIGWNSGLGLYINYTFAFCLLADLIIQFSSGPMHCGRKFINGFVVFMMINGAIVFGTTNSRIVGTICLTVLVVCRIKSKKSETE